VGKLPIIFLLLLVLWVGFTLYREGPERAFGGLFALLAQPQYGEADAPHGRSGSLAERVEEPRRDDRTDTPWWAR
jgi:hypothetical protein